MKLKIRDSHLRGKVENKCLNVRERVEVVEWNKRWSIPFPCCPVNCQCQLNPDRKKLKLIPNMTSVPKKQSTPKFSEKRTFLTP